MNSRQTTEDLFEHTRMSFGQHLEELRKVLIRCLICIALGCVVGFSFASRTVEYLKGPLVRAMAEYDSAQAADELVRRNGFVPPEMRPWLEQEKFVPRQLHVDPAQLVQALRAVIPDLDATVEVNPYRFRASHFLVERLPELCQQLVQPISGDVDRGPRIGSIRIELSADDQQKIRSIAQQQAAANTDDAEVVADILDRVAQNSKLYQSAAFEDEFSESPQGWLDYLEPAKTNPLAEMRRALDRKSDSGTAARLNRALITDLFSDSMQQPKLDLVPVEFWEPADFQPQSLTVTEPFMIWMKAGLITGVIIALPFVMYFLWTFVAAGLYPHEQKYVHLFLPISIALFVAGVSLAFFFVFQPVLGFLFSFNRQMGIAPEMRINDWLSFVLFLPLGFGLAFQLPLVMLFMNRINLFTVEAYLDKWRIAVMFIFVASMILTPADPISMLLMAIPLTFLYFLGVAMCYWMPASQNPYGDDTKYTTA